MVSTSKDICLVSCSSGHLRCNCKYCIHYSTMTSRLVAPLNSVKAYITLSLPTLINLLPRCGSWRIKLSVTLKKSKAWKQNKKICFFVLLTLFNRITLEKTLLAKCLSLCGICVINLRLKMDWASLKAGRKFTVFALFYLVFEGNFQVQAPGGLIFGGAI